MWAMLLVMVSLIVTCQFQNGLILNRTTHLIPVVSPPAFTVEEPRIVSELQKTQTIGDTMRWWTGSWAMGENFKYYRPLTSIAWWLQFKAFGENGVIGFLIVLFLSHMAFTLVTWGFLKELAGLKIATATSVIFASSLLYPIFGYAAPVFALTRWIDQPEAWCGIFIIAALWAYLRFIRSDDNKNFGAAIMFFIIAILFKESAYVTPFLAVALLWYEKKLSTQWKSALVFFGVLTIAVVYRTWALQGTGFKFGSNGSWIQRMISEVGLGSFATPLLALQTLPFAIGFALMAVSKHKDLKVWLPYAFAALACYAVAELRSDFFGDAISQLLNVWPLRTAFIWIVGVKFFLWLWMWHRTIERRERLQAFALIWVLIAYLPLLRAPVTAHGLYFMAPAWALWGACVLLDLQPTLAHFYAQVKEKRLARNNAVVMNNS